MTGIFYGSTTGTTELVARNIARALGIPDADLHNVADTPADETERYDLLLLGSPTWGCGELQDDWYGFLEALKGQNLQGKRVALFGCGDSASYPDTFCDALGLIYEALLPTGCTFIGACDPDGCDATASRLCREGRSRPKRGPDGGLVRTDPRRAVSVRRLRTAARNRGRSAEAGNRHSSPLPPRKKRPRSIGARSFSFRSCPPAPERRTHSCGCKGSA